MKDAKWSSENVNYIVQIRQLHGKQEQFLKQKPAELDKLVEIAKIQSTEASNAIESIRTTNTRLKQLVEQRTSPKNRDEEEIAGYRDVLNLIHESCEYISITPNIILQLHQTLYSHNSKNIGIGGKYCSSISGRQWMNVEAFDNTALVSLQALCRKIFFFRSEDCKVQGFILRGAGE